MFYIKQAKVRFEKQPLNNEIKSIASRLENHDLVLNMSLIHTVKDDYQIIGKIRTVRNYNGYFRCSLEITKYPDELRKLEESIYVSVDVLRDKQGAITGVLPVLEKDGGGLSMKQSLSESKREGEVFTAKIHEITTGIFNV